ncbi:MAG TPA: hypothetical protein VNR65_05950 [Geobacterales bacterium]|nr:hypothetical protein [Geobacterales bacterium]
MSAILTKRIAAVVERRDFCKSRVASALGLVASVNVNTLFSSFRRIRKILTGNS